MEFWDGSGIMQTICISLRTENRANTSSLNFFTGWMLFLAPNQQGKSTEASCWITC